MGKRGEDAQKSLKHDAGGVRTEPGGRDRRQAAMRLDRAMAVQRPAEAAPTPPLHALDAGDLAGYDAAIGPTVPLSRLIFEEPTYYYKTGVAFLAWLNGLQPRFAMLDGLERRRPASHLIKVFELAAAAGAFTDPDLAVTRMTAFLKENQ